MEELEKIPCPVCGNAEMAPILYGYPTPKWIDLAKLEKIALGGTNDVGHTHYCYKCNEVYPAYDVSYDTE
jgi:hypothetical protein